MWSQVMTKLFRLVVLAMVLELATHESRLFEVVGDDSMVPCYFIFGDSLADTGNNNVLQTTAKADYSPYGIDFPDGPTGRFSNGRTIPDIIGELVGFKSLVPPFATANGTEIIYGVNYASGSAGILNETGEQLGQRIPMNMQLENHQITISSLVEIIGSEELTSQYTSKCLYSVSIGSDDFINNYFMPEYYNTSEEYTLEEFSDILIENFTQQLVTLYSLGARKIAVYGLGLSGCTPDAINTYGTNGSTCYDSLNNASLIFNAKLLPVLKTLNAELLDATFIYIDAFATGVASTSLVLPVTDAPCYLVSDGQCIPNQSPCTNRSDYAFWDGFHPSEVFNIFSANLCFNDSNSTYTYPYDIISLVMLDQAALVASI